MADASVAELSDRMEIAELTFRYARAMDRREWELMGQVFTDDATANMNDQRFPANRDQIVDLIRRPIECCSATQHLMGNHQVLINGSGGRLDVSCRAFHVRLVSGVERTLEVVVRYDADVVRPPDGWRIRRWHEHSLYSSGDVVEFFGAESLTDPGDPTH